MDLVLEEFPVCVLAITPFPPPTHFHLPMYVPAEAGGKTLYVESEATLMGQTLQKPLRTFIIPLLLLVVFPIAAGQHHHISLQLGTDGGSAVVAEVQHSSGRDPQAQQHAEVVHQQNRGSPIPRRLHLPATRAAHTGLDGLVETP